jgi:hypothetical protein
MNGFVEQVRFQGAFQLFFGQPTAQQRFIDLIAVRSPQSLKAFPMALSLNLQDLCSCSDIDGIFGSGKYSSQVSVAEGDPISLPEVFKDLR